jgi:hypothetical protein
MRSSSSALDCSDSLGGGGAFFLFFGVFVDLGFGFGVVVGSAVFDFFLFVGTGAGGTFFVFLGGIFEMSRLRQ